MNKKHSRWIAPLLSRALSVFPVVVVAEARQVGKTTLVRELCPGPKRKWQELLETKSPREIAEFLANPDERSESLSDSHPFARMYVNLANGR